MSIEQGSSDGVWQEDSPPRFMSHTPSLDSSSSVLDLRSTATPSSSSFGGAAEREDFRVFPLAATQSPSAHEQDTRDNAPHAVLNAPQADLDAQHANELEPIPFLVAPGEASVGGDGDDDDDEDDSDENANNNRAPFGLPDLLAVDGDFAQQLVAPTCAQGILDYLRSELQHRIGRLAVRVQAGCVASRALLLAVL